ncbi:MAG TPA: hypothetical protein DDW52_16095 [Planctomycetaceae bacterium]|nr:hypothetical protein [Planctomycetaceae bacterium]
MADLKITDVDLDELVCGETTPARYRQILESLDAQPERWRDCALRFLEEQAITSELKSLAGGDAPWQDETAPESKLVTISQQSPFVQPNKSADRLALLQKITSIAASLLLAFTVGWVGSDFLTKIEQQPIANQATEVSDPPSVQVSATKPIVPDPYEPVKLDSSLPPGVQQRLEQMGYKVSIEQQLVPVQFEDGRSFIVPVNEVRAVPSRLSY